MKQASMAEFVALMAFTMALVALSIDAMLPAFPAMAGDLGVSRPNDMQLVISLLFTGLAVGQLFYGPLSDSIGRKPAIYLGTGIFMAGSLVSMFSSDFGIMLAGRLLQGIGVAGPRTVALALIRDRYHGSSMARVMSFIMTVFILVPIFAPAFGQFILLLAGWRAIFGTFVVLSMLTLAWLGLRQPETLLPGLRKPFRLNTIRSGFAEVLKQPVAMIYTLVTGCISGAFFGYLNVCQQIFQVQYQLGPKFPVYFGLLATSVGLAALINGSVVMRFGMRFVADSALRVLTVLAWLFLLQVWLRAGQPPLWLFMANCLLMFFCIGVLFGNLNSIAMEPLGHVAGTASAVLGTASTLVAVGLGYLIGMSYNLTLYPLATGFAVLASLAWILTRLVKPSRLP